MWPEISNKHFLSNIDAANADLIRQAAQETGAYIAIENEATCVNGIPLPGYVAVYSIDRKSKSDFWRRYDELRAALVEA